MKEVKKMALFTISDLHLPLGIDKPMNVFGSEWDNYVERIENNWQKIVSDNDMVILPGDFSWASYLNEARADFEFLNRLNGHKILLKGNHDYWWTTKNKMDKYLEENNFSSIKILHNECIMYEDIAICGNRGWNLIPENTEDKKIYLREIIRLELSLQEAKKKNSKEIFVFTHFPPIGETVFDNDFTRLLEKYNVKKCFYGHLHGESKKNAAEGEFSGIEYRLISSDYRKFIPYKII